MALHKLSAIKKKAEGAGINPSSKLLGLFNNFKAIYIWEYGPIIFEEKYRGHLL